MELVICPECGGLADVEWRDNVRTPEQQWSAVAKIRCVERHWFITLASNLEPFPVCDEPVYDEPVYDEPVSGRAVRGEATIPEPVEDQSQPDRPKKR